ncbi:glycoside hydrolase family 26 protein [Nocardioides sp. Leaf307]|uniref:glycoside hydrolase family 26 protein n=1 Tax=Nocardioides sp. Leaf307 TaxID=1736331 RepID=UPI0007037967|nr:glycosyl hydrolase [Nocardioides sp. Leaf307]KQQ43941.1 hypothetical protein ASF50_08850 [Nocardioides sp. Leaf307]
MSHLDPLPPRRGLRRALVATALAAATVVGLGALPAVADSAPAPAAVAGAAGPLAADTVDKPVATALDRVTRTTRKARAKTLPARVFGLAIPGAPTELSEADALASSLGRRATQLTFYSSWHYAADFPTADARRVASTGAVPEVTWEPWDPAVGTPDQPAYSLDRIAGGAFDAYVTRWAQQVKAYGAPVAFRFAHEMNGSWYPWSEGVNGNTSGDYVAAWRRVVGIFRSVGATNAIWTWTPNVPFPGSVALPGLYPGDRWVDRVGLDGYNWAGLIPSTSWQSFGEVFGPGLAQLTSLTAKPVFIGEVGCPEGVGDKAGWIRDMWTYLDQHREVRGLTWFHFQKEADWRITSSQASHDAFRAGVGAFAT